MIEQEAQSAAAEQEEAALIAGLRRGDPASFERIIQAYGGRLLVVARRILGNEEDARDAVQEAFLSAFKSIDRFERGSRFYTWLHRIGVNASLMKLRTRRRRDERSIEEFLPQFLDDGHQARPARLWREDAESLVQQRENRELVRRCIGQLPDNYRVVLLLRDIEEFDTEQTAQILSMTPGAVKTQLHRARQALRALLDPHFQDASK